MAEALPEGSDKIGVIAETAAVRNLTERLPGAHPAPAKYESQCVIEAKLSYEMRAGSATGAEERLKVAQRDPGFSRNRGRAEVWIGERVSDDVADA
jgi:hypothetical protein